MSNKYNLFLGRAGQAHVKSEFLCRGWNTAVPDVDIGDDMFVVETYDANFRRIQVKTASAQSTNSGYSARFKVPLNQLDAAFGIELYYVFVIRFKNKWQPSIIISREQLSKIYEDFGIVSKKDNQLFLYFNFNIEKGSVICSGQSFTPFLDNWEEFPLVVH